MVVNKHLCFKAVEVRRPVPIGAKEGEIHVGNSAVLDARVESRKLFSSGTRVILRGAAPW